MQNSYYGRGPSPGKNDRSGASQDGPREIHLGKPQKSSRLVKEPDSNNSTTFDVKFSNNASKYLIKSK
jgi:hypothetical protein